ncbi:MAG: SPOR domain-containing protein [Desulfamplus sp.]
MLYFFRNISIRLCIAVAISIPAAFLLLPTIQRVIPNLGATLFCIAFICALFILTGYIMNIAGERSIQRYITEAKTWERDGVFHKSEACYLKALEIFDSYLLTILTAKKIALQLTGAIARFSLTSGWHNSHFDRATIFFLLKNPNETEVAYLWLKKVLKTKFSNERKSRNRLLHAKSQLLSSEEENLITLIAEMEPLSPKFVPLLAEIFTQTARADFAAKRIFAIMQRSFNNECLDEGYQQQEIQTAEELSAKEYSSNFSIELPEQKPLSALKYSDELISDTEPLISSEHSISKSISKIEDAEQYEHLSDESSFMRQYQANRPFSSGRKIRRNIKGVKKPSSIVSLFGKLTSRSNSDSASSSILSVAAKVSVFIVSLPMNIVSALIDIVKYIGLASVSSFRNINRAVLLRPELGKNIRRLMLLAVTTGIILFLVNTVAHLFHTPEPPPPSTAKVETEDAEVQVVPQKRFTIQVAAYLVKSHAEQYLSNLAKKGVKEGAIAAVEGGGKTWYLIRVGKYETKEIATDYGNQLKSQGIVNDFFVDNSSR